MRTHPIHRITTGEDVADVAVRLGVPCYDLVLLNGLPGPYAPAGTVLRIPTYPTRPSRVRPHPWFRRIRQRLTPKSAIRPYDLICAARSPEFAELNHVLAIARVEKALIEEGLLDHGPFGVWSHEVAVSYSAWQSRVGFDDYLCDGEPGLFSLRALGDKHGFTVG